MRFTRLPHDGTAPVQAVSELTIEDPSFRRSVLALRWLLLAAYVLFSQLRVLDVSNTALLISASLIGVYDIYQTILLAQGGPTTRRLNAVIRMCDVVTVTAALIALHDVKNPVWAVYFLSLVIWAHTITRKEMAQATGWVIANYIVFAFITAALGHDVSWPYVITVVVLLNFMGFNAAFLADSEQRLRHMIAEVAVTDSLTGLPNRRRFREAYPVSIEEATASRMPMALLLIDFDNFKAINDRYGHPAGDDKLREVAAVLRDILRGSDIVARYGGDEFIVIAPGTSRPDAIALAERLREAAKGRGACVSIGVAIFPDEAKCEDALIAMADTALYAAKQAGRDCVRTAA